MQGKKFPVDVFKVAPSGPAALLPAEAPASDSVANDLAAAEDTSAPAADLEDAAIPASQLHVLNEQLPIVGRQVAPCMQAPQSMSDSAPCLSADGSGCAAMHVLHNVQEIIDPIMSKIQSLLSGSTSAGGIVLLEGEAGIGKSRVMAALRASGLPEGSSGHLLFGRAEAATKSRVLLQWARRVWATLPCTAVHLLRDTHCSRQCVRLHNCRCCTPGETQFRLFVGMTWPSLPMHSPAAGPHGAESASQTLRCPPLSITCMHTSFGLQVAGSIVHVAWHSHASPEFD
jgi:hypothetical protein